MFIDSINIIEKLDISEKIEGRINMDGYLNPVERIKFKNGSEIRFIRFKPEYIKGTRPNYIMLSESLGKDDFSRIILSETIHPFNPVTEDNYIDDSPVSEDIIVSKKLVDFLKTFERNRSDSY